MKEKLSQICLRKIKWKIIKNKAIYSYMYSIHE